MDGHRSRVHPGPALAVAAVAVAVFVVGSPALAQTTTTTTPATPTTVTPTTVAPTTAPTTAPVATTTPATTTPATPSTEAPLIATKDNSGSSIPWVPIAIGAVVLLAVIVALALWARRRGARRQALADWRAKAASTTAEAGATARLLSTGAPLSRQIAQQVLTSLRAFEDLAESAPDEQTRAAADRGRRALQSLGMALDADYQLRRAQPPVPQERLDTSADALRNAATDTDRALRRVYRGLTETD